jgi:RimJ/RimL family protein N-acetyltransferase
MAAWPDTPRVTPASCWLEVFQPQWAALVVSWVQDEREAYWLAPKTPPPLTTAEINGWRVAGHEPYVLMPVADRPPIGYGELNTMNGGRRSYWLGHLIVDPAQRGRGCGVQLTKLLLREAFLRRGARRVTLVVFPENRAAVACYRAAGMHDDGYEAHEFAAYRRHEFLLRMAADGPPRD